MLNVCSEPETVDQIAGVGKRLVNNRTGGTIERNTLFLRRGPKAIIVSVLHDACLEQLVIKSAHHLHRLRRRDKGSFRCIW